MNATEPSRGDIDEVRHLYLDLLKKTLTRYVFAETWKPYAGPQTALRGWLYRFVQPPMRRRGLEVVRRYNYKPAARAEGMDWPPEADTMIGLRRLDNIQACVADVVKHDVPGDLIETGVWRGGAVIFMRALLESYGDTQRTVWVADSFQGLPRPDETRTDDVEDAFWQNPYLAVPLERVKANFERYGLLDGQVRFLPGWFEDTLPTAPIEDLSILRLDGDMYDSTMVALRSLYPKLSVGGYVIVDDYHSVRGCKQAVDDFRAEYSITDPLTPVDQACQFWQRST